MKKQHLFRWTSVVLLTLLVSPMTLMAQKTSLVRVHENVRPDFITFLCHHTARNDNQHIRLF